MPGAFCPRAFAHAVPPGISPYTRSLHPCHRSFSSQATAPTQHTCPCTVYTSHSLASAHGRAGVAEEGLVWEPHGQGSFRIWLSVFIIPGETSTRPGPEKTARTGQEQGPALSEGCACTHGVGLGGGRRARHGSAQPWANRSRSQGAHGPGSAIRSRSGQREPSVKPSVAPA